jgi:hypothetical protein
LLDRRCPETLQASPKRIRSVFAPVVDGFINILDVGMTLPPYFGYMCT